MTHTAGFEETARPMGGGRTPPANSGVLRQESRSSAHLPTRYGPAYSNYATTLAGYIVQRVSGKPFEQYVAENIFTPWK